MKNVIGIAVLLLGLVYSMSAQTPLTNADVIAMSNAGIPATVIISKIKTSSISFKTDIDDLKTMTDAHVPDAVISAMVESQAESQKPKKAIEYNGDNAEHGSLTEISGKKKVFLAVTDVVARQIIVTALTKEGYDIVDVRQDADFGIIFGIAKTDVGSNALLHTNHNIVVFGEMGAYTYLPVKAGEEKGRVRYLWQERKKQDFSGGITFDRHPAKQLIGSLLKALKKN